MNYKCKNASKPPAFQENQPGVLVCTLPLSLPHRAAEGTRCRAAPRSTDAKSSNTRAEQTALVLSASLTPGQEEALSPEAELVPAYPPNSERHNSREQGEKPPCRQHLSRDPHAHPGCATAHRPKRDVLMKNSNQGNQRIDKSLMQLPAPEEQH